MVDIPLGTKHEFVQRKIKFEDGNSLIEKSKEYESPRDKTTKKKAVEKTG